MYALEIYKFLELMRTKATCDSKEDFLNSGKWTTCNYQNWTDLNYPYAKWY